MNKLIVNIVFTVVLSLMVAGCWGIKVPAGTPPPDGQVIIKVPKDEPIKGQDSSVNSMFLFLNSECREITEGRKPVPVMRDFDQKTGLSSNMSTKLWRLLIDMGVVREVSKKSLLVPAYKLFSTVKPTIETVGKGVFCWHVKLLSSDGKKEYWKKTIYFKKNKEE